MRNDQEIALQLTLKAIERMDTRMSSSSSSASNNQEFSDQVVAFYNNIYSKLDRKTYN